MDKIVLSSLIPSILLMLVISFCASERFGVARRIDEIRSYKRSKNGFSARLYPYEVVADYGMESVIWEGEIIVRGGIPEEAEFVGNAKVCTDDECTHMPEVRRRLCDLLRSNDADFYYDIGLLFAAASDLRMDGCVIEPGVYHIDKYPNSTFVVSQYYKNHENALPGDWHLDWKVVSGKTVLGFVEQDVYVQAI